MYLAGIMKNPTDFKISIYAQMMIRFLTDIKF